MRGLRRWETAVALAALSKSAFALAALLAALVFHGGGVSSRTFLMAAHVAVYGSVSVFLLLGGRRDHRAVLLGMVLLLIASTFADPVMQGLARLGPGWQAAHATARLLQLNALSPYFLWRFVREFPRVSWFGLRGFVTDTYLRLAAWVGGALLAANVLMALFAGWNWSAPPEQASLWFLSRFNALGAYWALHYALSLPAAVALFLKTPAARPDERRRVWILVGGFVSGTLPTTAWVTGVNYFPVLAEVLPLSVAGWVIYPALLSPPFTTAYAVLVHQALDVRVVARRAIRYALARYTLGALAVIPGVWLAATMYQNRNRSMTDLVSGPDGIAALALTAMGVAAIARRRALLDWVDRVFFPQVYLARVTLGELTERCRVSRTPDGLAAMVLEGVAEALAPEAAHVLFLAPDSGCFVTHDGSHRPLPDTSAILPLLTRAHGVLEVDLSRDGSRARNLPEEDRFWLADGGSTVLFGVPDRQGGFAGLISLGERRDNLPYTAEDRRLLAEVAKTVGVTLEFLRIHGSAPTSPVAESNVTESAMECGSCGSLHAARLDRCGSCGDGLTPSGVPLVLANKFRLVERLGAGGMGVVYRGVDLSLGRPVAVKTLPRTTPGHATRLRHEARAMAAVSHPNLAMIFGGESWHGVPMLVVEYLAGGTLTDRLRGGPLPQDEVVSLGVDLAGAVMAMHRRGILHRDIKPSNIGFTEDGLVKLLDFGLARILGGASDQRSVPVEEIHGARFRVAGPESHPGLTAAGGRTILGTPLYLSPEAVNGAAPGPAEDLWALAVTLFEAAAGRNPMEDGNLAMTMVRIVEGAPPDLAHFLPDADPALADFFRAALSRERGDRPGSASDFAARLRALRSARAA